MVFLRCATSSPSHAFVPIALGIAPTNVWKACDALLVLPSFTSPAYICSLPRFRALPFHHCSKLSRILVRASMNFWDCRGMATMAGNVADAPNGTEAPVAMSRAGSVRQQLAKLVKVSLNAIFPEEPELEPIIAICQNKFGDYQCNNAMGIWSKIKGKSTQFGNPNAIGQAIASNMPHSDMIERVSVAGPGFVNFVLSTHYIEEMIQKLLLHGVGTWAPVLPVTRAVVDFSSPNIAKAMHVGHLRSTIIGDSLARMLEYCSVDVMRRNHVGDWGTQFGMLIQYLFEEHPDWDTAGNDCVGNLQAFYKESKRKFDNDSLFKERAQQAVVSLQGGDERFRAAWLQICDVSRKEYDEVYQRLDVRLEEKGESFYNPFIPGVLRELEEKGLIKESEGAKVIFFDDRDIPLIVVKKDGGYNYASTDLAALWYRLNEERAEWVVYVTDVGQSLHFEMFFNAAQMAGWLPKQVKMYPKVTHIGFGLVLGSDGKRLRTRSSDGLVKLVDLLDEAKNRSKQGLVDRGREEEWTSEELEKAAEALGYGAIKYADLKNNRLTNYTFNFDQMLDVRGNTAVYLLYAHARICSIIRKSEKNVDSLKQTGTINLVHANERQLGLHLVQFPEIVEDALGDLHPNILCEYLYNLSEVFTKFYSTCKVVGSKEETSRLLLCEAAAMIMRACFNLLGITPLYRL